MAERHLLLRPQAWRSRLVARAVLASVASPETVRKVVVAEVRQRLLRLRAAVLLVVAAGTGGLVVVLVGRWLRRWFGGNLVGLPLGPKLPWGRQASNIDDPLFGTIKYSRSGLKGDDNAWEIFMNGLNFPTHSPIREHIRQLFSRPQFDEELRTLFDWLVVDGSERLTCAEAERFSQGIKGHLYVLTQCRKKMPLVNASKEDQNWLREKFDEIFPEERPLNRENFNGFAKLVLLRRVVRTLMESIGLQKLQGGVAQPLVVQVRVELGGDRPPFKLHTVAPVSRPALPSGENLCRIREGDGDGMDEGEEDEAEFDFCDGSGQATS